MVSAHVAKYSCQSSVSLLHFLDIIIFLDFLNSIQNHEWMWSFNSLFHFLVWGPSSAVIVVRWEVPTSNLSGRTIWQLSDDPYHTGFVSWHKDPYCFSLLTLTMGEGVILINPFRYCLALLNGYIYSFKTSWLLLKI